MKRASGSHSRKSKALEVEPIPMRPPRYFANSKAEIQEENHLAKYSVIRAPKRR